MKNRASLVLIELLVMVLVFSLAAAVCLGLFARANAISLETSRRDQALVTAQSAAQLLKSGADPLTRDWGAHTVTVEKMDSGIPGLATARIRVSQDGELLFTLTTGWQEVLP